MGDGRERAFVLWQAGDDSLRIPEPALGETDNSSLAIGALFNGLSVLDGPTCVQSCFNRDDVSGDGPDRECRADPGDHVGCAHAAMEQEHVDELSGAGRVAIDFPCLLPERFMGGGEGSRLPGACKCCRAGERAGLVPEDLEVVIQLDRLASAGDHAFVPGDFNAPVEDDDLGSAERRGLHGR